MWVIFNIHTYVVQCINVLSHNYINNLNTPLYFIEYDRCIVNNVLSFFVHDKSFLSSTTVIVELVVYSFSYHNNISTTSPPSCGVRWFPGGAPIIVRLTSVVVKKRTHLYLTWFNFIIATVDRPLRHCQETLIVQPSLLPSQEYVIPEGHYVFNTHNANQKHQSLYRCRRIRPCVRTRRAFFS